MYTDGSGCFPWLILAALLLFTPIGGVAFQAATSAVSYAGIAVASIFDEGIRADMNAIGWNPFNSNELAVLNSNKVSFYRGVPIYRISGNRSGSFYAIGLTKTASVTTLHHEWGHNIQAMMMGPGNFGLTVGIMSPNIMGAEKWSYYDSPWETMADIFGGVKARSHTSAEITRAKIYTIMGTVFFPSAYLFLI